jgi:hypothetical protein
MPTRAIVALGDVVWGDGCEVGRGQVPADGSAQAGVVSPAIAMRLSVPAVIARCRLDRGLKETSFSTGLGAYEVS